MTEWLWQRFVTPVWIGFLLNLAFESSRLFIPLLTRDLGGTVMDVGLVGAANGLAYFVAAFVFGRQADLFGRLRFIRIGLAFSALAFLSQLLARDVNSLLVARTVVGFAMGITTGALVVYAYENHGGVGKFSSFGALGLIAGSLASAVLKEYHLLFALSFLSCAAAFLLSLHLQEYNKLQMPPAPRFLSVIWRNRAVYWPFFLRQLGASAIWIIFPLFLRELGADKSWIAVVVTTNYAGQAVLMALVERFTGRGMFRLGLFLSGIVFLLYTVAAGFLQVIPMQALLSLAWSMLYIEASVLLLRSGEEKGTAAGIMVGTTNLCMAAGPFMGGFLSSLWGYHAPMFAAAALSFAGLLWAPKNVRGPASGVQRPASDVRRPTS
ncbi:MAG: MFS transporter [Bacillota bacterium]